MYCESIPYPRFHTHPHIHTHSLSHTHSLKHIPAESTTAFTCFGARNANKLKLCDPTTVLRGESINTPAFELCIKTEASLLGDGPADDAAILSNFPLTTGKPRSAEDNDYLHRIRVLEVCRVGRERERDMREGMR